MMRNLTRIVLMLAAVFAQIATTGMGKQLGAGPNYLLVYLVVASLFFDFSSLIWLALGGGFILDLYSGSDFGINMAFYVLLVIAIKAVLSLSESPARNSYVIIVVIFGTIFYSILMSLSLINIIGQSFSPLIFKQLGLELLYNTLLAFLALGVIYSFAGRDKTAKTYKLGKLK